MISFVIYLMAMTMLALILQRSESELEGMAVASSESPAPVTNPEDSEGHKEASGKKKKNRCMSCKKKVGLTGNLALILKVLQYFLQ